MAKNTNAALAREPSSEQQAIQQQQASFREYVTSKGVMARLGDVASKYMQPEEIMRCLLVAASRTPKILECTRDSVLRCMMEAAQLGIRPGGMLGRGWLIPRWNGKIKALELNFDPGWRGLVDIARRSKVVTNIEAHVVYKLDKFRVIQGTEPQLIHEPYEGEDDPGPVVAAYAVAFFENGKTQFERVRRHDLDKIQAKSESKNRETGESVGPWDEWYEEMARKSAVKRLCKYLPIDEELQSAIDVSNRTEVALSEAIPALPVEPAKPRAEALAERIRSNAANAPEASGDAAAGALSHEEQEKLRAAEANARAKREEQPPEREPGEEG